MSDGREKKMKYNNGTSWIVVIALFFFALIYLGFVVVGVGGAVFDNKVADPPRLELALNSIDLDVVESKAARTAIENGLEQQLSGHSGVEVLASVTIDELDATSPRLVWALGNALLHLGYVGFMVLLALAAAWSKSMPVFDAEFAKLKPLAWFVAITLMSGLLVRSLSEGWVADAYGLPLATVPGSAETNPFELFGFYVILFICFAAGIIWRQGTALQTLSDETV